MHLVKEALSYLIGTMCVMTIGQCLQFFILAQNGNKILSEKCKQSQENFVILSKQSKYLSYPKVFTNNKSEILLSTKL